MSSLLSNNCAFFHHFPFGRTYDMRCQSHALGQWELSELRTMAIWSNLAEVACGRQGSSFRSNQTRDTFSLRSLPAIFDWRNQPGYYVSAVYVKTMLSRTNFTVARETGCQFYPLLYLLSAKDLTSVIVQHLPAIITIIRYILWLLS